MPKSAKSPVLARAQKVAKKPLKVISKVEEQVVESKDTKRYHTLIARIEKRDGRIAPFEFEKIVAAIHKAMIAGGNEGGYEDAEMVAHQVAGELARFAKKYKNFLPTVEGIQDSVEKQLMLNDFTGAAKAYILYRDKRNQLRSEQIEIPESVRALAEESKKYFKKNSLGEFVYLRSYSKWIPEEGRRETWVETVDRYHQFYARESWEQAHRQGIWRAARSNSQSRDCPEHASHAICGRRSATLQRSSIQLFLHRTVKDL